MIEHQKLIDLRKNFLANQLCLNSREAFSSKTSGIRYHIPEQQSFLRNIVGGSTSSRSKGLKLSLKKQVFCSKQQESQLNVANPQFLHDSDSITKQNASTLLKTAHSIHHLGKSLSKSKQERSKQDQINKQKSLLKNVCTSSYHFVTNSARKLGIYTPQKNDHFSTQKQRAYEVVITLPNVRNVVEQTLYSLQHSKEKVGKVNRLKNKQFLRSSRKQSIKLRNNCIQDTVNKMRNKPSLLKTSHKNQQIQCKRQFLQSYIKKPMINSIIVHGKIQNMEEQPQSPVLRLKKRLQLNSINCIFQKQTLISQQAYEQNKSRIQVQESVIVHRNISQNFVAVTHKMNLFFQGEDQPYKLYLGRELRSNLILTIKQMPVQYFEKFVRQIRVYQQIQANKFPPQNVLQLIKYSTDSDRHLMVKQPYTETLHDYLESFVMRKIQRERFQQVLDEIQRIIRQILLVFQQRGIILKRKFTLDDFVFLFLNLKFENIEMFQIGNTQKLNKEEIIREFRGQMENYFNRVSSGSMDW